MNSLLANKPIRINFAIYFLVTTFILNETVRSIANERLGWMNIPFLLGSALFFIHSVSQKRIRSYLIVFAGLFIGITVVNTLNLNKNITYIMMSICNLFMPLLLLTIKITKEEALIALKNFTKYFNVLIIFLTVLGILDFFLNASIQLFFGETIYKGKYIADLIVTEHYYGIYRMYSLIGHPLVNAFYFLLFFVANNVYARYEKPLLNVFAVSSITMIGLLLCGSKMALIIGVVLILFFSDLKKRYKKLYYSLIPVMLLILFNTSLFQENLKLRFLEGLHGDITTGRNDLIKLLLNKGGELPAVFLGGGSGYSREISKSLGGYIYNFEYPSIMLAYDYGIIGMLMIFTCIVFVPAYIFIKTKNYYILLSFILLITMLNTNNGLANLGSDTLIQLCFISVLLMNISQGLQEK